MINQKIGYWKLHLIHLLILAFLILTNSCPLFAQISVTPSVGIDFSSLKHSSDSHFGFNDINGINTTSVLFGLNVEYRISQKLSLAIRNSLAKHRSPGINRLELEYVPVSDLSLIVFRSSLEVTFYPSKYLFGSLGPAVTIYNKPRVHYKFNDFTSLLDFGGIGIIGTVGYLYKGVNISCGFSGDFIPLGNFIGPSLKLKNSYCFFFTVGYTFNLIGIFNSDKVVCPTI